MTRLILAIVVGWFLAGLVTACAYSLARWYTRHTPLPWPPPSVLAPCPDCGHPEAMSDRDRLVCLHCMTVWASQEVAG